VHSCTLCALFSRFGLPRQLHSDQGCNFESKLVAELCSITGINKTRTTPFHPRSDGQTERANRTILQMLRASIDKQPESWADRLPALLAAYRMTPHSVTSISPNMAMLGRGLAAAGGARRSHNLFCGRFLSKRAQRACVRSQRGWSRCENSKELLRRTRQGTSVCTKSISVALLATPFVAQ